MMNANEMGLAGLTIAQGVTALVSAVLLFLFLVGILRVAKNRLKKKERATNALADDLLLEFASATKVGFLVAASIYLGVALLPLPARWHLITEKGFVLIGLWQFASWASIGINFWITRHLRKKAEGDAATATTIGLISFLSKLLLFVLIALLALNNLGVNITALVAGLGVGGIAVALALQSILGDLFASLTIVLDKPFIVGDFVVVGDFMGTIEHIGLKTTRIRSLSGEQLIFSNGDLLQSRIRNFKRMNERRVVFSIGVTYQTSREKLEKIPGIVREIVQSLKKTRFDRAHFLKFNNASLDFEIVYWVLDADFNFHADVAQEINLKIFSRFIEEGIEFAYPTQTVFLEKGGRADFS